ncbi:MAG: hypothetical protein AUJ36_03935 [Parcubacteria group bacterium CG1_02_41_26]|nr:MAG: hypothetical protein AUJ36_03935 [Parcubacteria group bacterium CG1_02_41_26]
MGRADLPKLNLVILFTKSYKRIFHLKSYFRDVVVDEIFIKAVFLSVNFTHSAKHCLTIIKTELG